MTPQEPAKVRPLAETPAVLIRPAAEADAETMAAIYSHHVLHGFGTFEEVPPTAAQMEQRRRAITAQGLPWLVAERAGRVVGYAYAGSFRPRAAYRYTVEDSVYVAQEMTGQGVGRAVLSAVLDACAVIGLRQVMAVIGDSQNVASIGLHRSLGFQPAGLGKSVGFKHGRWVDVVWMQKSINSGDVTPPDGQGLKLSGH
jgi:phosphinothricin acetyltransferase